MEEVEQRVALSLLAFSILDSSSQLLADVKQSVCPQHLSFIFFSQIMCSAALLVVTSAIRI